METYQCECGEDFYEDDVSYLNCGKPIDKSKLKDEEVADVKYALVEAKIRRGDIQCKLKQNIRRYLSSWPTIRKF